MDTTSTPHHPDKRARFAADAPQRGISPAAWVTVAVLVVAGLAIFALHVRSQVPAAVAAQAAGHDVSFALSEFDDGQARFYTYRTSAGREVRFFLLKSGDGVVRAAFDTCDTCYRERRGYRQAGNAMVCNNCSQSFRSEDINVVRGGCNPAPIERAVQGDRIVLRAAALEAGSSYF
jgi:uncharacterized membrane protein